MDTTSTMHASTLDSSERSRPIWQWAVVGAVAATLANVVLWAVGRAADVGFGVSPFVGEPFQVGPALIVPTTLLTFAVGAVVLGWAARRSQRWVRAVMIGAAVFAVLSAAAGPLPTADETATGVLLAAMHVVTGAVFVETALLATARRNPAVPASRPARG